MYSFAGNQDLAQKAPAGSGGRRDERVMQPSPHVLDLMCYSAALLVIVFQPPLAGHARAVADILKFRVSMENLFVAALCLTTWSVALRVTQGWAGKLSDQNGALLTLLRVCLATTVVGILLPVLHRHLLHGTTLPLYAFLCLVLTLSCRAAIGMYRNRFEPAMRRSRTVLIVGCGPRGRILASQLGMHPRWRYELFGFLDPAAEMFADVLGDLSGLEDLLSKNPIDEVIIALPIKSFYNEIQYSIAMCERVGVQSRYSTDLFETQITKRRSYDQHDPHSILLHMVHDTGIALKRVGDVGIAVGLLLCLIPVLLAIAVAISLTSEGPVLFHQQRYGLNRRLFTMYKFRTMVTNAEKLQASLEDRNETAGPVFKIKQDPRITGIGSFLRKNSLDELPQLWNVLIGDMSLVGPRPLPVRDVSRFSDAWLMRRFSVPPGITGLWQVSGRSNTSFDQWIQLDLDYIDRWSLRLDMGILIRTFSVVLRGEGAA